MIDINEVEKIHDILIEKFGGAPPLLEFFSNKHLTTLSIGNLIMTNTSIHIIILRELNLTSYQKEN